VEERGDIGGDEFRTPSHAWEKQQRSWEDLVDDELGLRVSTAELRANRERFAIVRLVITINCEYY